MAKITKRQRMWKEIAEAYATLERKRTEKQRLLTKYGLCVAIEELEHLGKGTYSEWSDFNAITYNHQGEAGNTPNCGVLSVYCWPLPDDESRALFAYLMSHLTDREHQQLVEDGRKG